jgi:hypothetical protein
MCGPVAPAITAGVAVAQLGLGVASSLSKGQAQTNNFYANAWNANAAAGQSYNALQLQGHEEADAAAHQNFDVVKEMTLAKSKATVAQGESGTDGVSFSDILSDYGASGGRAMTTNDMNYRYRAQQTADQEAGVQQRTQAIINSSPPPPTTAGTIANIGAQAVGAGLKIADAFDKGGSSGPKYSSIGDLIDKQGLAGGSTMSVG